MAKRRRVEEEEETLFKEPEFDEKDFLLSEVKKAKGIIIVFLLAAGAGLLSAYLQVYLDIVMGFILGILVLIALKNILKVFSAEFKDNKTWVFAVLTFIVIWISIWSVGLNPPFNDVSPPQVRFVEVYNGTAWVEVYNYTEDFNQGEKNKINENKKSLDWNNITKIRTEVTDNVAVAMVEINGEKAKLVGGCYEVSVAPPIGDIKIIAKDSSGHQATLTVSKGT